MPTAINTASGGFRPNLVTDSSIVGREVEFLYVAGGAVWDRSGVTLDSSVVTADGNGDKILVAGTVLGNITATGKKGPYAETGASNETVEINSESASSGDFTLSWDGETTAAIAYNATAATVLASLLALSNLNTGDISVAGTTVDADDVVVTFVGQYAGTDVPDMTLTDNTDVTMTVTVTDGSAGTVTDGRATAVGILGQSVNLRQGDVVAPMLIEGHVVQSRCTGYNANAATDLAGAITFH